MVGLLIHAEAQRGLRRRLVTLIDTELGRNEALIFTVTIG